MVSPPASPSVSPRHSSTEPSQSAREEGVMQIFIKTPADTTTTLTIPSSTSIATVKSLVALQVPSAIPSANTSLTFAGRHLDAPEKTLSDYNITPSSTLQLSIPLPGGGVEEPQASAGEAAPAVSTATTETPTTASTSDPQAKAGASMPKAKSTTSGTPKRKGPRCGAAGCNALAQRIVGECGFCGGNYCGKHRLLESHSCSGLETAKQKSKDQNKEKLERERTIMTTGLGV